MLNMKKNNQMVNGLLFTLDILIKNVQKYNKLVLARGYLFLEDDKFEEALIPAKHYRLDFLRFLIKREFNNYAFNGFYCNIFLLINE